jgi:hypothetical protein
MRCSPLALTGIVLATVVCATESYDELVITKQPPSDIGEGVATRFVLQLQRPAGNNAQTSNGE